MLRLIFPFYLDRDCDNKVKIGKKIEHKIILSNQYRIWSLSMDLLSEANLVSTMQLTRSFTFTTTFNNIGLLISPYQACENLKSLSCSISALLHYLQTRASAVADAFKYSPQRCYKNCLFSSSSMWSLLQEDRRPYYETHIIMRTIFGLCVSLFCWYR